MKVDLVSKEAASSSPFGPEASTLAGVVENKAAKVTKAPPIGKKFGPTATKVVKRAISVKPTSQPKPNLSLSQNGYWHVGQVADQAADLRLQRKPFTVRSLKLHRRFFEALRSEHLVLFFK